MSQTLERSDIPDTDADDIPARPGPGGRGDDRAAAPDSPAATSPFVNAPGQSPKGDDVEYEIIHTDEAGKPLAREGGLSTDEVDEGTLLERRARDDQTARHADERRHMSPDQRRKANKEDRDRRRAGRDRSEAERAALRDEVQHLRRQVADLAGLAPRLDAQERARVQDTIASYATSIEAQEAIAAGARQRMAQAMTDQDGDAMAQAMEMRDNAIAEKTRLLGEKKALEARVAEDAKAADTRQASPDDNARRPERREGAPPQLSRQAESKMEAFFERHPWIDRQNPQHLETALVLGIDRMVAAQGLHPDNDDYWDAVEEMMAASPKLRRLMDDEDDEDPQPAPRAQSRQTQTQPPPVRRGPAVGGGSERGNAPPARPGATQVHLSPGRKDALIAAGVLDRDGRTVQNREKFQRMMKQYAAFDAENGRQA